jgi:hypothetical protein
VGWDEFGLELLLAVVGAVLAGAGAGLLLRHELRTHRRSASKSDATQAGADLVGATMATIVVAHALLALRGPNGPEPGVAGVVALAQHTGDVVRHAERLRYHDDQAVRDAALDLRDAAIGLGAAFDGPRILWWAPGQKGRVKSSLGVLETQVIQLRNSVDRLAGVPEDARR